MEIPEDTLGLHVLSPPNTEDVGSDDFNLDIVAVHGLDGDAFRTWTDGNVYTGVNWLQRLLPGGLQELSAKARIMTFGYNANIFVRPTSERSSTFARNLCRELQIKRQVTATCGRPVVFVCHSLGGIVVKAALVEASLFAEFEDIKTSTRGVVFLGCPHHGVYTLATLASLINHITNTTQFRRGTNALQELKLWSESLLEHANNFKSIAKHFDITSFHETDLTKGVKIVNEGSTVMGLEHELTGSLQGNHTQICKFGSAQNSNFVSVKNAILRTVVKIKKEEKERAERRQHQSPTSVDLLQRAMSMMGYQPQGVHQFQVGDYFNGQEIRSQQVAQIATASQLGQAAVEDQMRMFGGMRPEQTNPSMGTTQYCRLCRQRMNNGVCFTCNPR